MAGDAVALGDAVPAAGGVAVAPDGAYVVVDGVDCRVQLHRKGLG